MSSLWKIGIPPIDVEELARPRVELCRGFAVSKKYDSKRRKKWNRRILLCKAIKELTLTHVKDNEEPVWLNVEDIQDLWLNSKNNRDRNGRRDMTTQEIVNRLRPVLVSDFVNTAYCDKHSTVGGFSQRWRVTMFAVSDMDSLDDYITYCIGEREKI